MKAPELYEQNEIMQEEIRMTEIEKAIDAAFAAQIKQIYNLLTNSLSGADTEDKINQAKESFRKALAHSERTRAIAREIAGL